MIVPTFVVILVATVLAKQVGADDLTDKFQRRMDMPEVQKCIVSTGYQPQGPPPKDMTDFTPEQMCFFKCVMEETGLIKNGKIDQDELGKVPIPEDKMAEVKKCAADTGKVETCEDMTKLFACMPQK